MSFKVDTCDKPKLLNPCVVIMRGISSVKEIQEGWNLAGNAHGWPMLPDDIANKGFEIVNEHGVARIYFEFDK